MTVYTRKPRVVWTVPWWLLPLWLPFYAMGLAIWCVFVAFWLMLVGSWKAVKWVCGSLKIPRGVDSDGEGSQV